MSRALHDPDSANNASRANVDTTVINFERHRGERGNRSPQGLRPQIALIVEALARAAARHDYRRGMEAAARPKAKGASR